MRPLFSSFAIIESHCAGDLSAPLVKTRGLRDDFPSTSFFWESLSEPRYCRPKVYLGNGLVGSGLPASDFGT